MAPPKGRQKRGELRRKAILEAAVELFGRNGFHGTSLADIAGRVEITAPAIYHHFSSKEELLQAVISAFDREYQETWEELTQVGGLVALRRLPEMTARLAAHQELTRLLAVLGAENLTEAGVAHQYFVKRYRLARRWVAGLIRTGQDRGEINADVDAEVKAAQIVALQSGLLNQHLLDPRRVPLETLYADFIETVVHDIGVQAKVPA